MGPGVPEPLLDDGCRPEPGKSCFTVMQTRGALAGSGEQGTKKPRPGRRAPARGRTRPGRLFHRHVKRETPTVGARTPDLSCSTARGRDDQIAVGLIAFAVRRYVVAVAQVFVNHAALRGGHGIELDGTAGAKGLLGGVLGV